MLIDGPGWTERLRFSVDRTCTFRWAGLQLSGFLKLQVLPFCTKIDQMTWNLVSELYFGHRLIVLSINSVDLWISYVDLRCSISSAEAVRGEKRTLLESSRGTLPHIWSPHRWRCSGANSFPVWVKRVWSTFSERPRWDERNNTLCVPPSCNISC